MTTVTYARVSTTASPREAARVSGLDEARIAMLRAAGHLDGGWGRRARLSYADLIFLYLYRRLSEMGVREKDIDECVGIALAVHAVRHHLMARVEAVAESRFGETPAIRFSGPDVEPAARYLVVNGNRAFRCADFAAAESFRDEGPPAARPSWSPT